MIACMTLMEEETNFRVAPDFDTGTRLARLGSPTKRACLALQCSSQKQRLLKTELFHSAAVQSITPSTWPLLRAAGGILVLRVLGKTAGNFQA
jgi:hypothetical protein